jgi:ligand-binding SRPBCC domain-containing protein
MSEIKFLTKGSVFRMETVQQIPISLDEAWDFFSSPSNLKVITPDYMGFEIIFGADRKMFPGQIIEYKVSPLLSVKTNWVTEISHVVDKEYFVDEQRFGPYSLWHHKHFFKEIEGGVEMIDIVDYKLPFGVLGRLIHPFLVKPKLTEIFNYRRKKLIELFGNF